MPARVRIGAVNYLNTKPLIYDLERLDPDRVHGVPQGSPQLLPHLAPRGSNVRHVQAAPSDSLQGARVNMWAR